MSRIAVLVSGGGSNLAALIDAQARSRLGGGKIVRVISSRAGVRALERAQAAGIPTGLALREGSTQEEFDAAILWELEVAKPDIVVMAGFLSVVGQGVIQKYAGRIVNVHPSLLPAFGGPGMYGLRVHMAALAHGVKVTGATVHLVSEQVDAGEILAQKAVDVLPGDTPQTLQRRVMEQAEWVLLPQVVGEMAAKNREVCHSG